MYSGYAPKDQMRISVTLAAAWLFTGLSGIASIFLTPASIQDEIGSHLPTLTGILVVISSVTAMYGVMTNKHYIELVAAWFAVSGTIVYVIVVWYMVFASTLTRLQQAAYLSSLIFFYLFRVADCTAHARKQRAIHRLVINGSDRQVTSDDA